MNNTIDFFGKIIYAEIRGKDSRHEIERDDGLIEQVPGKIYLAPFQKWSEAEQEAIELVKGRILTWGAEQLVRGTTLRK